LFAIRCSMKFSIFLASNFRSKSVALQTLIMIPLSKIFINTLNCIKHKIVNCFNKWYISDLT
jgi:hypothetical protein